MVERSKETASELADPEASLGQGHLGLGSGVGLVIANMIGAGVFLSSGYMAQTLDAGEILLSWVVGLAVALCGAWSYAALAVANPRSGGEYRYLHDHLHPFLGYLSGWASLLVGFSAAIAIDAFAAGAFLERASPGGVGVMEVAVGSLVVVSLLHMGKLDWSRWGQNALVGVKIVFVLLFLGVGLFMGSTSWPSWVPPKDSGAIPWESLISNQYWVAFAFSGWNASIYISQEFGRPRRDVPRAMVLGATLVGVLYLVINWIVVANLTPGQAIGVVGYDEQQVTLAHLVMAQIAGEATGALVSAVAALVFLSALSAMVMLGPRVYAAMADDGLLPSFLKSREDRAPWAGGLLQLGVALALLLSQSLLEIVKGASIVLMISSALTASIVLFDRKLGVRLTARLAAFLYIGAVGTFLVFGQWSMKVVWTLLIILGCAVLGYGLSRLRGASDEDG